MNSTTGATQQPVDEHVFLIGRPPLGEYLGFVTVQTVNGQAADRGALADEWRSANDHIRQLERAEAGYADEPHIENLPSTLEPLRVKVLGDPVFRRSYGIVPVSIGMVELDRVVVFQKHINLEYVRRIKAGLGSSPDEEAVFRLCLPFEHPQPPFQQGRIAGNAYVFISPSTDLRFLESQVLGAEQISGYSPPGPVSGVIGLVVGFGSNFLNVIQAEGRLVLNNGSHRAFALRDLGISHAPCILQHVSRREELEAVCPPLNEKPDLYLKSGRPPLLKDYFDPKLRKLAMVRRQVRQVKITFGVEQLDVPAT